MLTKFLGSFKIKSSDACNQDSLFIDILWMDPAAVTLRSNVWLGGLFQQWNYSNTVTYNAVIDIFTDTGAKHYTKKDFNWNTPQNYGRLRNRIFSKYTILHIIISCADYTHHCILFQMTNKIQSTSLIIARNEKYVPWCM